MRSKNSNGSRASWARGFMAFCAGLTMGLALAASPAEAEPFAYVANEFGGTVSVIDTATNPPSVVATVPVGISPLEVAVTPDGKHVYVTHVSSFGTVSVIDTATNTVVATVTVARPGGIAITPDGKHAYVATGNNVSVIATATNTVVATVPLQGGGAVAVAPDGKHAYVGSTFSGTFCLPDPIGCHTFYGNDVSVIDTATNTVVAGVGLGNDEDINCCFVAALAVTPDGKHVYAAFDSSDPNFDPNAVYVIDTATNPPSVVATVPLASPVGIAIIPDGKHVYVTGNVISVIDTATNTVEPATIPVAGNGIAVAPDGKHAYVTNTSSGNVSVIATVSNMVVATVPVGVNPVGIAIVPPPPGVPFLAFGANLVVAFGNEPNQDSFALQTSFILSSTAPGINPLTQPVTLQAGTFAVTIPPGSFKLTPQGYFIFVGVINGARLEALIEHTGTLRYALQAKAVGASFTGTTNPAYVTLTIGKDSGATSVMAKIFN